MNLPIISTIVMIIAASTVIIVRLQAAKKPTSIAKILMPPIGMSTGFFMFLYPKIQVPIFWAVCAFAAGAIFFSYPLIRTSKFEKIGPFIYLRRSKAFIVILLVLLAVRLLLHSVIEEWVSIPQTAGLFFVLAFGMLMPWRIAMYLQYRKLLRAVDWELN